jgi:hypothetical protein
MRLRLVPFMVASAVLASTADGQPWRSETSRDEEVQTERQFRDDAGLWSLTVVPVQPENGERRARGEPLAATYRMDRDGNPAWEAELPFVFDRLCIASDGTVVGYAHETGFEGRALDDRKSLLIVAAIGPDGLIRWRDDRPRGSPTDLVPGYPVGRGVTLKDNMVSIYATQNSGADTAWRYRLDTGERLGDTPLRWTADGASKWSRTWVVASVRGAPFDVVVGTHLVDIDPKTQTRDLPGGGGVISVQASGQDYGAQVMVVDAEAQVVWEWNLPAIYGGWRNTVPRAPLPDWTGLTPFVSDRLLKIPKLDGSAACYEFVEDKSAPEGWDLREQ